MALLALSPLLLGASGLGKLSELVVLWMAYSALPLVAGIVMAAIKRRAAPIALGVVGSWPLVQLALGVLLPDALTPRVAMVDALALINPLFATPLVILLARRLPATPPRAEP